MENGNDHYAHFFMHQLDNYSPHADSSLQSDALIISKIISTLEVPEND